MNYELLLKATFLMFSQSKIYIVAFTQKSELSYLETLGSIFFGLNCSFRSSGDPCILWFHISWSPPFRKSVSETNFANYLPFHDFIDESNLIIGNTDIPQMGQLVTNIFLIHQNQSHYREVPRWEIFMEQELRFWLDLGRMADFPAFIASKSFDLWNHHIPQKCFW